MTTLVMVMFALCWLLPLAAARLVSGGFAMVTAFLSVGTFGVVTYSAMMMAHYSLQAAGL